MNHTKKVLSGLCLAALIFSGCSSPNESTAHTQVKASKSELKMENVNGTAITLKGNVIHTVGKLPAVGTTLADATLTSVDLEEKKLSGYKGKYVVMNIFPSVNTGVCSKSVRKFNEDAANLKNTTVLCISKDLPFAQKAFCGAEGINNVVMLSDFRTDFGQTFGVEIAEGPMKGLLSRAVIVADPEGKIIYQEQVSEIGNEPDYAAAIAVIQ
jgi:thiol peroxidase